MVKDQLCSRQSQIVLAGIIIASIIIFSLAPVQYLITNLHELSKRSLNEPQSRCEFPLIYNKPPKTASTKIRNDLIRWSSTVHRQVYTCSSYILQAIFEMRECIPEDNTGCAIVANHMHLSHTLRDILTSKIGHFKLLTSTRNPPDRIFSFFLQMSRTKAAQTLRNTTSLRKFLAQHNPWDLYNYHTGEGREGSCPLTLQDEAAITDLVNRADIVIDADLRNISNVILSYQNLFELNDSVANQRADKVNNVKALDRETRNMLQSVACVEEEMHRMFRLRMASMYQKASGVKCLSNTRYPTPTCF